MTFFRKVPSHRAPSRAFAGVYRRWSMDCRQNCCDESATDLPRSPAVLYPAQSVGLGHLGAFPEHLPLFGPGGSARGKARQVIVAGLLRTRRDTSSGDPWTTGAKHPPNSRDGARCGALKAAAHAHGRAVGAVPSCRPAKMVAYFWCPTFLGVAYIWWATKLLNPISPHPHPPVIHIY